ncbi:MAG: elongation factor G [Planctomycetaceae bacterium]|nr:elongation factor G [Planctomycetaceae bacterium]
MARFAVENLRNVAFVGHGGVGKTSLADHMLFHAGKNTRIGSVDDGTSLLDTEEDEKHRKHSIVSSVCHFEVNGKRVNLIDAPGMPDFAGQGIGALRGVETAGIVINAAGGIAVNTRKYFQYAGERGLARFIVLNRLDGENINLPALVESIRNTFGNSCALFNVPIGIGHDLKGVTSTINVTGEAPAGCVIDPREAGQQVIDTAVEADETLMERFLGGEAIPPEELSRAITKAIAAGSLIPIFCTSAKADIGVKELMDAIANYAPSPDAVRRKALNEAGEFEVVPDPDGPIIAQVFKTRIDPFVAKMSYLRVYSGTLHKDTGVKIARSGKSIKLAQLFDLQGAHHEPVDDVGPGEIVAVVKVDDLHTSDTVTRGADDVVMPAIKFPMPMIGLAVEPKTQADQAKISTALHKIEEEDPCFQVHREAQTHEMVMNGMSELHLQLIQHRLETRDKVQVITHQPKVPYRETVNGAAEGSYRHKKQSGGSGQFAEVHFRVSHCPQNVTPEDYFTKDNFASLRHYHYDPDLNFCFIDRVTGGSVPNQFIPAVEKGVKERLTKGCLAGYQIQDVVVELFFGKDHPVDSNETAFKTAASMCLREVFNQARPVLLEPIVEMEITVPSDKIGDITSDLNTRRGRMDGMEEMTGGYTLIKAHAPLAEVMTYARSLSSLTGGQGSFALHFGHYEVVPPNEQQKIVAAAKRHDEEEA